MKEWDRTQERLERLERALDIALMRKEDLEARIKAHRTDLERVNEELPERQHAIDNLERELLQVRSERNLARTRLRETWMQAERVEDTKARHIAALQRRLLCMQASPACQLGHAIIAATKSWQGLSALPGRLRSVHADGRRRERIRRNTSRPSSHTATTKAINVGKQCAPMKLVFGVKTYNRKDYLQSCLTTWLDTRNPDHHWVVIIADDGSTDGTLEYLETLTLPHKVHIIRNHRRYTAGQTNSIFERCSRSGFDVGFNVDDDVVFLRRGWDDLYLGAMEESGYQHLSYLHKAYWESVQARRDPGFVRIPPLIDETGTLEGLTDVYRCMGAFFTFTPEVLQRVGPADEFNFPVHGEWDIDYSARCAGAGFNSIEPFWDARGSNDYIEVQNSIDKKYRCASPKNLEYMAAKREEEIHRRLTIIYDANRIRLPW